MTTSYWQHNAHLPMRATYSTTTYRRQRNLTKTLVKLRIKYSRAESERLAIADANQFQFTPAQIRRDIQGLRRVGSLDALIVHHNDKQKDSGLNETRDLYIQQCSVATYSTYEPHSQRSRTHANTATLIQVKALPITPPLFGRHKNARTAQARARCPLLRCVAICHKGSTFPALSDGALLIWRCGGTSDHDATPRQENITSPTLHKRPHRVYPYIRGIHRHVCQKPCPQRLVAGTPVYNKVHHSPGELRTTLTRPNLRGIPT
jgi:hypothetical protein